MTAPTASPPDEHVRSPPTRLLAVTLWRLAIAGASLHFALDLGRTSHGRESLSYLANQGVGIAFLALAAYPFIVRGSRHEPRSGWLRGALTLTMLLVALLFTLGEGTGPDGPHAVVPGLLLIDWLFIGRNQLRTRWWEPPTWTAFLLAYLVYHRANDLPLYPEILGPDRIGVMVPLVFVVCVVIAYALFWLATTRRDRRPSSRQAADGVVLAPSAARG